MKRLIIATLIAGVVGGCSLENTQKVEAYKRWHRARAQMICSVGSEHLKVGELDKAGDSATQALILDPDCVAGRILLGKVLLEKGRYAEASEEFGRAKALRPQAAEIHYLLGAALEKHGDLAGALASYQEAARLDPTKGAYATACAEVLAAMGNPTEALGLLETRLTRADDDAVVLLLAGELAMLVGQPAKAATFYQRCLDMHPDSLLTRESLAKARFFAEHYPEALDLLKKLAEHPEYREKVAWVYVMTGDSHMALKQPKAAALAYETALEIEGQAGAVWLRLAKAAMAGGDADGAASAAGRALELDKQCPEAIIVLGYALLRQGKTGEATALLEAAAGHHPDDATLRCMLGRCYAAQGKPQLALDCYRRALRSNPEHRLAQSLLAAAGEAPNEHR